MKKLPQPQQPKPIEERRRSPLTNVEGKFTDEGLLLSLTLGDRRQPVTVLLAPPMATALIQHLAGRLAQMQMQAAQAAQANGHLLTPPKPRIILPGE